jgi:hypothetical protein
MDAQRSTPDNRKIVILVTTLSCNWPVSRCKPPLRIAPPLYLIAIGSNGSVSVSRHTESGDAEVFVNPGADIVPPVLLSVVGMDGSGALAKIEIEAKRETVQ